MKQDACNLLTRNKLGLRGAKSEAFHVKSTGKQNRSSMAVQQDENE